MPSRRILISTGVFVLLSAPLIYVACLMLHNKSQYIDHPCGEEACISTGPDVYTYYDKGLPFAWQTIVQISRPYQTQDTSSENLGVTQLITDAAVAEALALLITFIAYKKLIKPQF